MEVNKKCSAHIDVIPMLPLRGISVFPGMLMSFDVERPVSISALNAAMNGDHNIMLVAQRKIETDLPGEADLFSVGVVSHIKQLLRVPGGKTLRVMVEGLARAKITDVLNTEPHFVVGVDTVPDVEVTNPTVKQEAMLRRCCELFEGYIQLSAATQDVLINVIASDDYTYVADYIAQSVNLKHTQKQKLLEEIRPVRRLSLLNTYLTRENNILALEQSIQEETQEVVNQNQKEYYLREQMKVIQNELGEGEDAATELETYRQKILAVGFDEETEGKLLKEVAKLAKQPFGSSEGAVIRGYLDTCLELPWNVFTKEQIDIAKARKVLDADHFGMEKVKERVIEYLAVRQIAPEIKGGILCFVGPPGTGKTSIAISIAKAMNRKLARIALGGVHDEADIRGHRKTYVGAMPGRIINGIRQAGSSNPLLLLDEIDKLGSDYRGDPSAALLEALDFEQNSLFRDHYLEIPYDLSNVFFITTANTVATIPPALLDRMEVIELSSYTDEEKLQIAKNHLLPKQRKLHGLNGTQLKISDDAIRDIVSLYTRESGVRRLERQLATICRKTAKYIATGEKKSLHVKCETLESLLGAPKYKPEQLAETSEVGLVRGLAWTSVGGEMLEVEVGVVDGSGKLELTGNLGDVMKESAKAAMTYIRSRAAQFGIDPAFYKKKDIHIHFPEGAIPKDGPSAGITMTVGMISALTGIPVRRDVAMTGEVTLRGRILPIGGLKEKTMAALRNGVHHVIIPADNEKDLEEIDQTVRAALQFTTTDHVDKILDIALVRSPLAVPCTERKPELSDVIPDGSGHVSAEIRQ